MDLGASWPGAGGAWAGTGWGSAGGTPGAPSSRGRRQRASRAVRRARAGRSPPQAPPKQKGARRAPWAAGRNTSPPAVRSAAFAAHASMLKDLVEEVLRAGLPRIGIAEEILLRAVLQDLAAHVHEDHAVADLAREAHFMGHAHHGHAFVGQAHHHVQHLADHFRVQGRGGLVEEHHDGVHRQRARDRHALLLPAGQLARELVLVSGQAHAVEHLEAALLRLVGAAAEHLDLRDREVLRHRQVGEQLEVLEHHADLAAQLGQVGLRVVDGHAVDVDLAFLDGLQCVDRLDQRGFARARRAAHDHHFALADGGGAVVQHLEAAVPLGNVLEFNHLLYSSLTCRTGSADDGDLAVQALHRRREREAHDEVHDRGQQVGLDRATIVLARGLEALEHVVGADGIHERRILEQDDGLGQQHRQHVAERLRQDHELHVLPIGHAQRLAREHLATRYGLDAGPHDLAEVRGLEGDERDHGRHLGPDRPAHEERHQQKEPQDHHHQRDAAHAVDVDGGRHVEPFLARQPHQRQQRSEQHAADRGHHGQHDAEIEALEDELADDVPAVEGKVEIHHVSGLPRCRPRR